METARYTSACRYRWSKVVTTDSHDVVFYPSYAPNDPILLSWVEDKAYFSPDLYIICGDHHGNLVVDGKTYSVEEFPVRTYTFEIDLFLKDDVIEDEVSTNKAELIETGLEQLRQVKSVDNYQDVTSGLSGDSHSRSIDIESANDGPNSISKIENLVKQQMTDQDGLGNEVPRNSELRMSSPANSMSQSVTNSKRYSPIGDDDVGKFTDSSIDRMYQNIEKLQSSQECLSMEGMDRSTSRLSDCSLQRRDVVDDIVGGSPLDSLSHNIANPAAVEQVLEGSSRGSRATSLRAGSDHGSTSFPGQDAIYSRPHSKASDRFSPSREDLPGLGRPASANRLTDQETTGAQGSSRPLSANSLNYPDRSHTSPAHSLSRTTPPLHPASQLTRTTPPRELPGDALYGSRDRTLDSSRPPSHPSSRAGSQHSSRAQSVVGSVSSEQELAQYLDNSVRSGCADPLTSPRGDVYSIEAMRGIERAASVPNYSTQYQTSSEKRCMTPDNRIRIPAPSDIPPLRNSLLPERMEETLGHSNAVVNTVSSRASSRTITPVNTADTGTREASSERIREFEATVSNLQKLLRNRESEVHTLLAQVNDLKDINRSLKEELDHRSRRHTPVSSESAEFKQLHSEKEILVKEVVSLREEVQRLSTGQSSKSGNHRGINDYSPNSPIVLQRKIADLEAQVRDLQEVNETTTSNMNRADEKLKLLQAQNREHQTQALGMHHIQSEGDQHLKVELRTLREDVRSLKARNFQLTEENMKLCEGQKSKPSDVGVLSPRGVSRLNISHRSDEGSLRLTNGHRRDRETLTPQPVSTGHVSHVRGSSREDIVPRELRHSALNRSYSSDTRLVETSARLLQEREQLEASRLSHKPRENLPSARATESARTRGLFQDRSRPDGEVAEKSYSDKYTKTFLSYERKSDDIAKDFNSTYLDKYSQRDTRPGDEIRDKYSLKNDGLPDREVSTSCPNRLHNTGSAISSKDIFFNLQQKRAKQWLEQENKYISGNLDLQRLSSSGLRADDAGDDSDTATDILLAQDTTPRGKSHNRRSSLGSSGSASSLSDGEDNGDNILRRRSKSVDANRGKSSTWTKQASGGLYRSGSASRPLSSMDNLGSTVGHRSVIPTPLVTQHNKGDMATKQGMASLLSSTLTHGMRPFAPRSPADVRAEDVVKFSRLGGKLTQGIVKYVGHLPGRSEVYLGVELDKDEGKHDGTFEDVRYFRCKPNKGVFVAFNKIVMAWAP